MTVADVRREFFLHLGIADPHSGSSRLREVLTAPEEAQLLLEEINREGDRSLPRRRNEKLPANLDQATELSPERYLRYRKKIAAISTDRKVVH